MDGSKKYEINSHTHYRNTGFWIIIIILAVMCILLTEDDSTAEAEIVYSEDFNEDPQYTKGEDAGSSVYWDETWHNYFVRVKDVSSGEGHYTAYSPIFDTVEGDFYVEFFFEICDKDWGNYPGIIFINDDVDDEDERCGKKILMAFSYSWSDHYKGFRFSDSDSEHIYTTPDPKEGYWYDIKMGYDSRNEKLAIQIEEYTDSYILYDEVLDFSINETGFNRFYLGQITNPPEYGETSDIRVDEIAIEKVEHERLEGSVQYKTDFNINVHGYNFPNFKDHNVLVNGFNYGLCYGISETSILYFNNRLLVPFGKENAFSLTQDEAYTSILFHHSGTENREHVQRMNSGDYVMWDEYQKMKFNIGWYGDPLLLLMGNISDSGDIQNMHAVVVIGIEVNNETATYHLYDSNSFGKYEYGKNYVDKATFNFTSNEFEYLAGQDNDGNNVYLNTFMVASARNYIPSTAETIMNDILSYLIPENDIIVLACPANAMIISDGNRIGFDGETIINEIPGASCFIYGLKEIYVIPQDIGYAVEIEGYYSGGYDLSIYHNITGTRYECSDIPMSNNESHRYSFDWEAQGATEEWVVVEVDQDGDGVIDFTVNPGDRFLKSDYDDAKPDEIEPSNNEYHDDEDSPGIGSLISIVILFTSAGILYYKNNIFR